MKKVLLCSLCLLVCALGINIPAVAQPSQKLVNVVVSPTAPIGSIKWAMKPFLRYRCLKRPILLKG